MHVRHPSDRLVTCANAPFPSGTQESEWRTTRSRHSGIIKRSFAPASFPHRNRPRHRAFTPRLHFEENTMGRGLLLWLLGVPIPVIILLWLFFCR
jgi:hypothetical protein